MSRLFYPYSMVHAIFVFYCRPYNTFIHVLCFKVSSHDDNGILFSFISTLRAGSCRGGGSVVIGSTGVVAFTTYGVAGLILSYLILSYLILSYLILYICLHELIPC